MAVSDKRTLVSFSLPKELKEQADMLAAKQNRSLSNLICTAIIEYINKYDKDDE